MEIELNGFTLTEEDIPFTIRELLKGIKSDGRKRGLSLLLAYFTSLEVQVHNVIEIIDEWNKKNYKQLNEDYIIAQHVWYLKNRMLPPNYDKPIYKELGLDKFIEEGFNNPINYTIKKILQKQKKDDKRVGEKSI